QRIPIAETDFIAFKKETVEHFATLIEKDILLYDPELREESYSNYVVLLDLPTNADQLKNYLNLVEPDRIYAHFYVANSHLFDGMPTREQFAWY
ncbi:MAG: single-stranded-DNA-specific exonuclease C-terminal domain-containing protein, partial [Kurthia sp.]